MKQRAYSIFNRSLSFSECLYMLLELMTGVHVQGLAPTGSYFRAQTLTVSIREMERRWHHATAEVQRSSSKIPLIQSHRTLIIRADTSSWFTPTLLNWVTCSWLQKTSVAWAKESSHPKFPTKMSTKALWLPQLSLRELFKALLPTIQSLGASSKTTAQLL